VGGGGGSDCIMPADGRFTWVAICWLGGIGSALYPAARSLPEDQNLPGWVPKNFIEKGKFKNS